MNSSLSDIKRRLASVKQTRQITGAMETVSVAKMRKANEKLDNNRAYTEMLSLIMSDIAASDLDANEFLTAPKDGKELVIPISSDRGLCGGFDHDIFKRTDGIINENTVVMPIGKTAGEYYKSNTDLDLRLVSDNKADYDNARHIAAELLKMYGKGIRSITVVYSDLVAHTSVKPIAKRLLPIEFSTDSGNEEQTVSRLDCFEPSMEEVCETLIPLYLTGAVYGALISSGAAEHYARRTMMSAATKSADEIINQLSIEYNRSRQSVITEQIVEISGSTEALKKNEKRFE